MPPAGELIGVREHPEHWQPFATQIAIATLDDDDAVKTEAVGVLRATGWESTAHALAAVMMGNIPPEPMDSVDSAIVALVTSEIAEEQSRRLAQQVE